jgi:Zn-dependent protease
MNWYINVFVFLVIIISSVFHEYAHGWAAYRLGDDTAEKEGRLTLNPIAHIDPFGTLLLPLVLLFTAGIFIGWAKPVPYNPYQLSDKKYGELKVAIAGPATNIILALMLGLLARVGGVIGLSEIAIELFSFAAYVNIFLALFNLIPVPPLDGSKVFITLFPSLGRLLMGLGMFGILIALLVAFYVLPSIAQFLFLLIVG